MENDECVPVMTTLSLALKAIIQLVKCRCSKELNESLSGPQSKAAIAVRYGMLP